MVYKGRTRLETKKNRTIIVTTETEKENDQALSILSRWTEVDNARNFIQRGQALYIYIYIYI